MLRATQGKAAASSTSIASQAMDESTFYCFPRLPAELRCRIWRLSVHQRTIYVRDGRSYWPHEVAIRPIAPAVMHCCREARLAAPYIKSLMYGGRYAWVNYDLDIIAFHDQEWRSHLWTPYKQQIKRMRIAVDWEVHSFSYHYYAGADLARFTSLESILIYILEGGDAWYDLYNSSFFHQAPGLKQGLRFVFPDTGLMLTGPELGMVKAWSNFQSWDGVGKANFSETPWEDLDVQYPLE